MRTTWSLVALTAFALGACSSAIAAEVLGQDAGAEGEAQAAAPDAGGPTTATEMCSQAFGQYVYAEHAYPGQTAQELAGVRAVGHVVIPEPAGRALPPVYGLDSVGISVRDGYVAAYCGTQTNPQYDSISFTGP